MATALGLKRPLNNCHIAQVGSGDDERIVMGAKIWLGIPHVSVLMGSRSPEGEAMRVGAVVHDIRKEKGLCQIWLAREVGMDVGSLERFERQEITVPFRTLSHIAGVLHVSVAEIIRRAEGKY